ncbi:MAG: hypothetical protein ACOX2I_02840 [Candidatus Ozemobacteraceae bacterium]
MAELLSAALDLVAAKKFLSIEFYEILPLNPVNFPESNLLSPLFISVQKSLSERPLLLTSSGELAAGNELMIAESQSVRELFTPEILHSISDNRLKSAWLTGDITSSKFSQVYFYLKTVLKVKEWSFEEIFRILSEYFYQERTDDWMTMLYLHLANEQTSLWKKPGAIARRLPFIRTEDGRHLAPFNENKDPLVFLPSNSESELATVKRIFLENQEILSFFQSFGIHEADILGEILGNILPKYSDPKRPIEVSSEENDRDLALIYEVISSDKMGNTKIDLALLRKFIHSFKQSFDVFGDEEKLETLLKILPANQILCLLLSNEKLRILRSQDCYGNNKGYRAANNLYLQTNENASYFKNNRDIMFVDPSYNAETIILCKIKTSPELRRTGKTDRSGAIIISELKPFKRGLDGFAPNAEVEGLRFALDNNISLETARFIWNHVGLPYHKQIKGEIEVSDYKTFKNSRKETVYSNIGKLLTNLSWLPDKNNKMRRPCEIALSDLPEGFENDSDAAKALSCSLGMVSADNALLISQLCQGDSKLQDILKHVMKTPPGKHEELLKLMENLTAQTPEKSSDVAPGIKFLRTQKGQPTQVISAADAPIKNPGRYKDRLKQAFDKKATTEQHDKKFVFVKAKPEEAREARSFLYAEYHGRCQITGNTFPKASANTNGESEYYFETVKLVNFNDNRCFDSGNMLCLSADAYAKFKYASLEMIDTFDKLVSDFKAADMQTDKVTMRIKLANEEATITWSKRHFVRFLNIYEAINPQC